MTNNGGRASVARRTQHLLRSDDATAKRRRRASALAILAAAALAAILSFERAEIREQYSPPPRATPGIYSDGFNRRLDSMVTADEGGYRKSVAPGSAESSESNFCSERGSLTRLALDMINASSPPGSPSYLKLRRILSSNEEFHIELLGHGGIFSHVELGFKRFLSGGGLREVEDARVAKEKTSIILVEGVASAKLCPVQRPECGDRPRIIIQSEQMGGGRFDGDAPAWEACHLSPNCVIVEFSDYNLKLYGDKVTADGRPLKDSVILFPVMTQTPSRLERYLPEEPRELRERARGAAFLGVRTDRRKRFDKNARARLRALGRPRETYSVRREDDPSKAAGIYADARVCLVLHSYSARSGGEYHRLSEFGPFGCVPVAETFADDAAGVEAYERCGGAVFAPYDRLFGSALRVLKEIDSGSYRGRTSKQISDWWKAGIRWETLLPRVYPDAPFHQGI